jgi:hypothetical protein
MDADKNLVNQSVIVASVANRILGLKTLDTQNSDSLDFHDLSTENIRAALNAAYEAGFKYGRQKPLE